MRVSLADPPQKECPSQKSADQSSRKDSYEVYEFRAFHGFFLLTPVRASMATHRAMSITHQKSMVTVSSPLRVREAQVLLA